MNIDRKIGNGPEVDTLSASVEGPRTSRWGNRRIWLNLCFLFITLGTAVYSVEQARWIHPQPYLTLILLLSIVTVWLTMVYRLPGWLLHLSVIVAGVLVFLWQGTMILLGGGDVGNLFSIISSWLGKVGFQEGNAKIIFGLLLVVLTWVTGYLSTWFVLRYRNAWVAVLLGLVIILVNLTNLPAVHFIFFIFFLLAASLLIVQTNAVRQQSSSGNKANYSAKSLLRLTIPLTGIIILSVLVSWITPQLSFSGLQDAVASRLPWKDTVEKSSLNIFNEISPKKVINTTGSQLSLNFGTAWNTDENIVFTVISPQPAYWQVNVYEKYSAQKWVSILDTEKLLKKNTAWNSNGDNASPAIVKYQVITNMNTDIVLVAGKFVSAEMPVMVHYGTEDEVNGVRSVRILDSSEKYTVKAYLTDYSADALSAAGDNYPETVKNLYFQLPDDLSARIRELSENLTASSKTPYDKILEINSYLSRFPYSLSVDPVPEGADPIDNFLFTQKKGFCMHFSSALTIMLRSVGVPARLVTGYVPGDPGPEKGTYILRDKHFHAWTQVYFPGYGWLDFDPTPGGLSNNQAAPDTPLISPVNLQDWNYWDLVTGAQNRFPGNIPASDASAPTPKSSKIFFADQLGIIMIIVMGMLVVLGLAYGILRIIRPFYSRGIWNIDRENPAFSAYAGLGRLAAMNGILPDPGQTPLEFSAQIAPVIPAQSQNLELLVRAYLDKRFGPEKGKPELYEEAEILKNRVLVYDAMLEKRGKLHRFFWQK